MEQRNVMMAVFIAVCVGLAAWRVAAWHAAQRKLVAPPPGHSQTWRCRADGYETNMTPAEILAQIKEKRTRRDRKDPVLELFTCPKCGKQELEVITRTPSGEHASGQGK